MYHNTETSQPPYKVRAAYLTDEKTKIYRLNASYPRPHNQ